ncbi:hypothetical protein [endosymbiont of unidentified scaly snail isolate Monju]|uniref:hypothetical protein n=1 Tax=endosymbiont of unidentified scaly snail isolate Monju TaxID=1248727 RepID=UPI0014942F3D|nr:hypothetical protein [endosymbiont of unidentified scaly snail isolate Monju]
MRDFLEKNWVVIQIEAIEDHFDEIASLLQATSLHWFSSHDNDHCFVSIDKGSAFS